MRRFLMVLIVALWAGHGMAAPEDKAGREPCEILTSTGESFLICRFDPHKDEIRLFLRDGEGDYYRHFRRLETALESRGETLRFAMNAGMYHEDRSPVGLYIENGERLKTANTNDGYGNFHLKPNGVFFIGKDGRAGVQETSAFLKAKRKVRFATQSGPMLLIGGKIHPRFIPDSPSRKRRNGVGVRRDGTVIFVLSDTPVSFDRFAHLFKDTLKTPNALYLDGTISRIHAPELGRSDPGIAMGPIVGVVGKTPPEPPVKK
ncbi:MAG TPA: phosphodiester glycosidase family protein [Hyphomicrobiales bacterium]|nr:phosphodiester glycosidase family protein [Hyphomicrobiales bacterium]